jgi:hypothetical protein
VTGVTYTERMRNTTDFRTAIRKASASLREITGESGWLPVLKSMPIDACAIVLELLDKPHLAPLVAPLAVAVAEHHESVPPPPDEKRAHRG